MAQIGTTLKLNDQMTATLSRIDAGLAKVTRSSEGLDAAVQRADNLMTKLNSVKASAQSASTSDIGDGIRSGAAAAASSVDRLIQKLGALAASYLSIQGLKKAIGLSDQWTGMTARIDMLDKQMNGAAANVDAFRNKIVAAANDSRGSLSSMTELIQRVGMNAGDAFGSSDELIRFANVLQKSAVISGASAQEAANAELQLSQALWLGVLRGQDFRSVASQMPVITGQIAQYLGVTRGEVKKLADDGKLTTDVVKNAILSAGDEVDKKFNQMPMTFEQAANKVRNSAMQSFAPVMERMNQALNSSRGQQAINGIINSISVMADVTSRGMDAVGRIASFVHDNWQGLAPLIFTAAGAMLTYAVATGAAAAAQAVANSAMLASPIFWIGAAVAFAIVVIGQLVQSILELSGVSISSAGAVAGVVAVSAAAIYNVVTGLVNGVITIGVNLYNLIASFAAVFGTIFNNPVAAIEAIMLSLFNFIVSIVSAAAGMIDAVFGSNLQGAVSGFQGKVQSQINAKITEAGGRPAKTLNAADYTLKRAGYKSSFFKGASWADTKLSKITAGGAAGIGNIGYDAASTAANTGKTAGNTGRTADKLDDTNETLKWLCDVAEKEAINRFTTAEISVDMVNHNSISSALDLDGIVDGLASKLRTSMASVAEGV